LSMVLTTQPHKKKCSVEKLLKFEMRWEQQRQTSVTEDSGGQFWKRLRSIKGYNTRRKRVRATGIIHTL
jgi:hypothetical protein